MPIIVDASVTIPWFIQEVGTAYATRVRARLAADSAVVPSGWPMEVTNGLLVAERRGRITARDTDLALASLRLMPIRTEFAPPADAAADRVVGLAREHGLTAYDAAYLDLAIRERAALATLDDDLRAAARRAGVGVVEG